MNLAGAITSLATGTYTITRQAPGVVTEGVYADGPTTTFDITAVVHPIGASERQLLPELERATERLVIYTATELKVARAGEATSDRMAWRGETWELESVGHWDEAGGFFKAIARKVDQ